MISKNTRDDIKLRRPSIRERPITWEQRFYVFPPISVDMSNKKDIPVHYKAIRIMLCSN